MPTRPTAAKIGTYVLWTAFATTAVTSSLFLTALAPNAAALAIAKKTVGVDVSWAQWLAGMAPLGLVMILLVPVLSYFVCRPEVKQSPEIPKWAEGELRTMGRMSRNEWIMTGLILVAMVLWITGSNPNIKLPVLGTNFINATMVVLLVISLLLITGVVDFADIVAEKSAWESFARPLASMSPTTAMLMLVALFFWIHYFFSSITSHTAAVLPVVLAVGSAMPGISVPTLTLLCVYSLGIMGVISPYATGPAPIYFSSGYIGRSDFWKFGLIFGIVFFAGLLLIVRPWLQMIG